MLAEMARAGIEDFVIWDNSQTTDFAVYGRYRAVELAANETCYSQDDDVIVPSATIRALLAAHEPGRITANMPAQFLPHYPDSCLLGFGAVFDADLPRQAFERYARHAPRTKGDILKRPDVVFAALTPYQTVTLPVESLPYAYGPDRMYRQENHHQERLRVLQRCRRIRRRR